jgi:simple sugar transport system substrate-binding protein
MTTARGTGGPLAALVLLAALATGACGKAREAAALAAPDGAGRPPGRQLTIGAVIYGEYTSSQLVRQELLRQGAAKGVRVELRKHNHVLAQEARLLRELVAQRVDAIIVSIQDPEASVPAVRAVHKAGIPLVCYGSCLNEEDTEEYIGAFYEADPTLMGYRSGIYLAQWAAEHIAGPVRIGLLNCNRIPACRSRSQGFRDALNDAGLEWIAVADREGYEIATAKPVAKGILTEYPGVQILFAANQNGTEGEVYAVREMGLQGKVHVFSTDYSDETARLLAAPDGILQAVTGQASTEVGRLAFDGAVKLARKEKLSVRHYVVGNPFYRRPPSAGEAQPCPDPAGAAETRP